MTMKPYLSVVATARNDNHGGNMLRRMQIFVNGLIEQSRRYQLPVELILVEWNPPTDRPKLAEALTWNVEGSPCVVRIIEVPPTLHQRLRYSQSLPLFQMIAKNVGIRRAQGEFILATNIDLLFSNALFEFLASRQLQPGKSYRVDRYDVQSDVPLEASLDEQFEYCDRNILRINHKDGIEEFVNQVVELEPSSEVSPPLPKWYEKVPDTVVPRLAKVRAIYKRLLPVAVRDFFLRLLPQDLTVWLIEKGLLTAKPIPILEEVAPEEVILPDWQYPRLHTNACGDFTLMSKQDWFKLRGYPEWEIFSFHLDSVLLYMAHYANVSEEILEDPIRVFHVDHSSGWTPQVERDQTLNKRLAKLKIPQLSNEQFDAIARLMEQTGNPLIVNDETWGMAIEELPEVKIATSEEKVPANAIFS